MEKGGNLYKLILSVQNKQINKNDEIIMIALIEKFRPLILKYKHLLSYEDAENDVIFFFIEMIKSIHLQGFNPYDSNFQLLSYISISMHNEYIKLSKAKYKETNTLNLEEWYYVEPSYNQEQNIEVIELLNNLQIREKQIIILKYWYGYSDIEVGTRLKITRQTVNRIVRRSLKKLRRYI